MGRVDFDDPNYDHREYDEFDAYGQSKTANILCAVELDRRLKDQGVRAFAVHPGGIHTELGRYFTAEVMERLTKRISEGSDGKSGGGGFEWKSIPAGAATSVWAATSPDLADDGGILSRRLRPLISQGARCPGQRRFRGLRGRPDRRSSAVGHLRTTCRPDLTSTGRRSPGERSVSEHEGRDHECNTGQFGHARALVENH